MSPHVTRAAKIAREIAKLYPDKYETWFFFTFGPNLRGEKGDGQGGLYKQIKDQMNEEDRPKFAAHKSVPFCWIESEGGKIKGVGGRDRLCDWVQAQTDLNQSESIKALVSSEPGVSEAIVDTTPGSAN